MKIGYVLTASRTDPVMRRLSRFIQVVTGVHGAPYMWRSVNLRTMVAQAMNGETMVISDVIIRSDLADCDEYPWACKMLEQAKAAAKEKQDA